jgi:hypothetical protein
MKIRKFKFTITIIFIFGFVMIPFSFADLEELGNDPKDDILDVNYLDMDKIGDWLADCFSALGLNPVRPDYDDLFEEHSDWFEIEETPDCVDVVKYGIISYSGDNSSLYITVEDITDRIVHQYFSIDIIILYDDWFDNNEVILWIGQLDFTDGRLTRNIGCSSFYDNGDISEEEELGDMYVCTDNNTYEIYFDTGWLNDIDLTENVYGGAFAYCWATSSRSIPTQGYIDFIPNSYFGQDSEEVVENDETNYNDWFFILFVITVVALLSISLGFYFVMFNKDKNINVKTLRKKKKK